MGEAKRNRERKAWEEQERRERLVWTMAGPQTPHPIPPKIPRHKQIYQTRPVFCPDCGSHRSIVIDIRFWETGGGGVRHVRCPSCSHGQKVLYDRPRGSQEYFRSPLRRLPFAVLAALAITAGKSR